MKHTIEISTIDALLLVQLLHTNNLENETDKLMAERLKDKILEKVGKNLAEHAKDE